MKKRLVSMLLAALTVLSLCTSALAASNGQAVPGRRWRRDKQSATVSYYGPEDAGQPKYEQPPACRPSWLPEGWGLEDVMTAGEDNIFIIRLYRKGSANLQFICFRPSKIGYLGAALYDQNTSLQDRKEAPAVELQQVKVQGRGADFYQAGSSAYLFWEDQNGSLYYLKGGLDRASMIQTAEGVKEDEDPVLPEYRLGWEPKGAKIVQRDVLPGAVIVEADKEVPGYGDVPCYAFAYSSEPLSAPEGKPETVKAKGAEARFWKGVPSNGTVGHYPSESEMSTLLWTDPETGIHFRLKGSKLSKADMLRMAESVVQAEAPAV